MQRDLKAQGLEIVGVSTSPGDTADVIKEFQKDLKQEYTILTGAEEIGAKFGNGPGLPVTHIIDREGRVRQKLIGQRDRAAFEIALKPLLWEGSTTAQR